MNTEWLTDREWEREKESVKRTVNGIKISNDLDPSLARERIAQIDDLYSRCRIYLNNFTEQKDSVDSMIREIERSHAEGSNEMSRKQNATRHLQAYPIDDEEDGETVNMYELQRYFQNRVSFYSNIIDILKNKQSVLITVNGMMKLEKDLLPTSGGMSD